MPCAEHLHKAVTGMMCTHCDLAVIEARDQERSELEAFLKYNGYHDLTWKDDVCIGLHDYLTTRGIVVGLEEAGYERRYCFQDRNEASQALLTWDGEGHPPGNWIKLKGRWQGQSVDLLNPNWSQL